MPSHTYYINLNGGFLDSDIVNVRRKAIEHIWDNRNDPVVIVYSNATMNREVGRVIYTGSWPIFLWKPLGKKQPFYPLRKDGYVRKPK